MNQNTFHITTFGCQMNEHDSEIIAGMLSDIGYTEVKERKDAEICIINTCSVRENADKRFFGTLGQLKRRKMNDPDFTVCVCGCMMQQQPVVDKIREKYPWVDVIFGTNNIHRLPALLNDLRQKQQEYAKLDQAEPADSHHSHRHHAQEEEIWQDGRAMVEGLPMKRMFRTKALVNITYGCNNFCTYCIVPYTRGRERSRAPEDILKEVCALAQDGVREVMLLGQNVNSYRGVYESEETKALGGGAWEAEEKDPKHPGDCTFSHLIRMIAEIDGIERIRFMTSHPKDLSDELIETFRTCGKLCHNIHLPVQAGSDRILKKMNRHYDREKYLTTVDKLREAVPDITMSTDIIVGFPGETEEDFQDTLDLVNRVRYDSAFTFLYSIRQGTPAAKYEDQIPEDVKHERFNRLVDLVDKISAEKNAAYEGRTETLLIEGKSKRDRGALAGRTDGFKLVNFPIDLDQIRELTGQSFSSMEKAAEALEGKFCQVRITKGKTFSLEGELLSVEPLGE